jgi:CelD/BcsL family acetyltransferase involved in cellulose biosynthesis
VKARVPPVPSQASVRVRWLSSSERLSAERIWEALEARVEDDALACSWVWTGVWLEHYGDVVPHQFAVGEVRGVPCGVALVTNGVGRRRGPFRVRSVHLGTAGEPPGESVFVEYNRVLVEPEHRIGFAAALISELRREPDWHEIALDGFAPEEAEPFLLAEPLLQPWRRACPTMDLRQAESAEGSVLATLKSGTRRKVRRSLTALGDVGTEWAQTPEHALDILDELIELHQRRWTTTGEPGAFASPRFADFHRELVARLVSRGAVILFRVRAAGKTVGCLYHFVERRRVLFYQSGLASYPDGRISPGFVAFALCMQACFERGLAEYDFLAGDSRYKRDLSTMTRELVWASGRRPALRWRLMDYLAAAKHRLRPDSGPVREPSA